MTFWQKVILGLGALLIFLRCIWPVRIPSAGSASKTDLPATLLQIIGIGVISTASFFIFKNVNFDTIRIKTSRKLRQLAKVIRDEISPIWNVWTFLFLLAMIGHIVRFCIRK
jgi:hypothetical protein